MNICGHCSQSIQSDPHDVTLKRQPVGTIGPMIVCEICFKGFTKDHWAIQPEDTFDHEDDEAQT